MFKNFFDFSNFKGDLFGGITAGIVALPLALAFGVSSGLGPAAGLYGAVFIAFFASLFGGTPTQISGPTAPVTAVSMVVVSGILATYEGNLQQALPAILTVFLLAGLFQISLGVAGIGKYIKYIPYPVVSGFMTAIGLIIIITQILPLLGYYPKEDPFFVEKYLPQARASLIEDILKDEAGDDLLVLDAVENTVARAEKITEEEVRKEASGMVGEETAGVLGTLKVLPQAARNINWTDVLLALGTILIVYGFKSITSVIPGTLAALIIMTVIAVLFIPGYRAIEDIPSGIPVPNLGIITELNFGAVSPYIFSAITLAMLGSIDSLLTSVVADNMTRTKHNSNRELIGQGIGNGIAALFGGIPGAGATIRTVVNINAGGRTKLSGMTAGVLLMVIILALGPVASRIPAAVLAGILFTVGIGVMDYKGLKAIPSLPKDLKFGPFKLSSEVLIMLTVMLLSTFWDLVNAVGIGLVLASLMFMKKMGDFTARNTTVNAVKDAEWANDFNLPERFKEEVYIKRMDGPLFFGVTGEIKALTDQIPDTCTHLIMRMDKVPYLDMSGVYTLEDIFLELNKKDIVPLLVDLKEQPRYMMERIDMIPDLIGEDHIFRSNFGVIKWVKKHVIDKY